MNYYLATLATLCLETACNTINRWWGIKLGQQLPSYMTARMYAAWCFGYITRKARLFLDFLPPYKPDVAMDNTIAWWRTEIAEKAAKNAQRSSTSIRRG
uniref:Uncharacterized protein n=1 Tax=Plectus sambesii TaxID=2011161 RepID=A0A914XCD3_9BILA